MIRLIRKLHKGNRFPIISGILLLSAAWAIWCVFWLPKGLDFSHVGLYTSDAWRLAQGDLPFLDTIGSSASLASYWLSFAFRIFPAITLLELRIIWAITVLLCAVLVAFIMLRYFNPAVSFTAAAASLFFVTGNSFLTYVYRVLSYNSMPYLPVLLAVWLWLAAYRRRGRRQLLLAAGAGIAAFLATTCRSSLVFIILLPFVTILYDRLCRAETTGLRQATIAYLASYIAGMICFFSVLAATGLSDAYFMSWQLNVSGRYSFDSLALSSIATVLNILLPALPVLLIVAAVHFRKNIAVFLRRAKQVVQQRMLSIVAGVLMLVTAIAVFFISPIFSWTRSAAIELLNEYFIIKSIAWFVFILAITVILVDVMLNLFNRVGNSNTRTSLLHERGQLGIIAVFIAIIMPLGTYGPLNDAAFKGGAWLTIALAACLFWFWLTAWSKRISSVFFTRVPRAVGVVLLVLLISFGMYQDYQPAIWQLNTSPETERLQGIQTTPERAAFVDKLVDAVESYSEPGDKILVYYRLSMLHYLTDRSPVMYHLNPTVKENEVRQAMLEDMIQRGRYPKIVVYSAPPKPHYAIGNPIDVFVTENYQVVEEIREWGKVPAGIEDTIYKASIMVPRTTSGGYIGTSYNSSWLVGWSCRKRIAVTDSADGDQTHYQMKLIINRSSGSDTGSTVYVGNRCASDYRDIRFTSTNGTTLLDYWVESSDSSTATVWIEFDAIAASQGYFYFYYGNAAAILPTPAGTSWATTSASSAMEPVATLPWYLAKVIFAMSDRKKLEFTTTFWSEGGQSHESRILPTQHQPERY